MNKMMNRCLLAVLPALFSSAVLAGGFQSFEQNASGLGVSYAGSAAVAENAGTIFYNPAGMTLLPGRQVSLGVTGIRSGVKFRDTGSNATFALNGSNGGDAGEWQAMPNAYFSWQLAPRWFVGLGISSPFGLSTQYEDPNWIGRFHALQSEIRTINVNPSLAYRLNDRVSIGFGLNYQRLDLDFSHQTGAGLSLFQADDAAWSWNAGALFTLSPAMRVGISYRAPVKYRLEGHQVVAGVVVAPAGARLEMPSTFTLSVWQQVSDRWEAMGDLSYTRWNGLDQMVLYHRVNGAVLGTESFGYSNAWRVAWGAAYKYGDACKIKFGIAYDRSPARWGSGSARTPDHHRLWLSLGGQWRPWRDTTLDVGYAYLVIRDPALYQVRTAIPGTANLIGRYDLNAHIVGVQLTQGF